MKPSELENGIKEALLALKVSGDSLEEVLGTHVTLSLSKGDVEVYREGSVDLSQGDLSVALPLSLSKGQRDGGQGDENILPIIQKELNFITEDISAYAPPADVLRLIPAEAARAYCVMPLEAGEGFLKTALVDPTDMEVLTDLHVITGLSIRPVAAGRRLIEQMIVEYYKNFRNGSVGGGDFSVDTGKAARTVTRGADATPVIRLVNDIISEAVNAGCSDIHFEPFEREMQVRYRTDGILRVQRTINSRSMPEVVSRIKIMANLDIAERRRPQDGRIRVRDGERTVDMRISTLPTEYGEKVVVRILDKGAVPLDLTSLGLGKKGLESLRELIAKPYGMILVTGPTGSGKTTTLYSALNEIKSPELNITTIEDPIEYKLDGIVQTAVKREVDLTFANALRTLLRQDPNIIMVGEIRDDETAQMAIRAALTGHMVYSTLHTNDAPSAVTRLLDMGMEPFLVASSVIMVMAQRLVRKVCPHCAEEIRSDSAAARMMGPAGMEGVHMQGKGCYKCSQTGYSGRIGLFEMMPVTPEIRKLINERKDSALIRECAVAEGMITLRQDGINKIKAGVTTPEEVLKETA